MGTATWGPAQGRGARAGTEDSTRKQRALALVRRLDLRRRQRLSRCTAIEGLGTKPAPVRPGMRAALRDDEPLAPRGVYYYTTLFHGVKRRRPQMPTTLPRGVMSETRPPRPRVCMGARRSIALRRASTRGRSVLKPGWAAGDVRRPVPNPDRQPSRPPARPPVEDLRKSSGGAARSLRVGAWSDRSTTQRDGRYTYETELEVEGATRCCCRRAGVASGSAP